MEIPMVLRGVVIAGAILLAMAGACDLRQTKAVQRPVQATHLPRCGVIVDPALQNNSAASLLEISFLQSNRVIPVERSQIDKIIDEQQIQAAFSPDGVGERQHIGVTARADVLVALRPANLERPRQANQVQSAPTPDKKTIEMVVFETRHGLRLSVSRVKLSDKPDADAAAMQAQIDSALDKYQQNIRQVIAVPPFASQDLSHEYDALEDVYPRLIQQMVVVKFELTHQD
jgi:hypothetical protein